MLAVESLLRHGINVDEISLILPEPDGNQGIDVPVHCQLHSDTTACKQHVSSPVVIGGEEGVGVGTGLGFLTALYIPGIGMFAGSGPIIASLVAAGAVIGGIAGGIYGYLTMLEIPHEVAEAMADHVSSGGATLSVIASDARRLETIVKTVASVGGTVIASTS